jgi:hypothetical protein
MDEQQNSQVENSVPTSDGSQATVLLSLEDMIKRHISSIETLQTEMRKHKEMFDDAFDGSVVYKEHADKVKEAQKQKSTTRQEILKQPQIIQLGEKIKTMREEMRELKLALSDYLVEFQRLSGLREIQDEAGEFREIINSAKAVKKATRKK